MTGVKGCCWCVALAISVIATPSYALTECEFIQQTMNKLGARMSILRLKIATSGNQIAQEEASKQLRSDTDDYRLAKKQYERSDCGPDRWSRD
jgi:hypothetical protein